VRTDTGPYLRQRWLELGAHPLVGEARIVGMMGAIELVPRKPSRAWFGDRGAVGQRCRDIALGNGLILRATNDAMLLSPPLVISRGQIDELVDKAWQSLDQTAAELGIANAAAGAA
jgi:putrescine aminotransferase